MAQVITVLWCFKCDAVLVMCFKYRRVMCCHQSHYMRLFHLTSDWMLEQKVETVLMRLLRILLSVLSPSRAAFCIVAPMIFTTHDGCLGFHVIGFFGISQTPGTKRCTWRGGFKCNVMHPKWRPMFAHRHNSDYNSASV